MKKLYIHMGMHKTGSTSIQNTCFKYKNNSFTYLDMNSANHNHTIYSLFSENPEQYYLNSRLTADEILSFNKNTANILDEVIKSTDSKNTVLSAEDLIKLSATELEKMKKYFSKYYEDIYIIVYVRQPISYMNSLLQQIIKSGVGFKRFVDNNEPFNDLNIEMLYPNYKIVLSKLEKVFGNDKCIIKSFNESDLYKQDVVKDFFKFFEIDILDSEIVRSNDSISCNALALIYSLRKYILLNKNYSQLHNKVNLLIKNLLAIKGKKLLLSHRLYSEFLIKKTEDLKWIERRKNQLGSIHKTYTSDINSEASMIKIDKSVFTEFIKIIEKMNFNKEEKRIVIDIIYRYNRIDFPDARIGWSQT